VAAAQINQVCAAIRTVARLQIAVFNVFEDGLDETLVQILQERYPDMLMPLLAESTRKCIEVCIEAFPDADSVCEGNTHTRLSLW
jgi:hypothetical protein